MDPNSRRAKIEANIATISVGSNMQIALTYWLSLVYTRADYVSHTKLFVFLLSVIGEHRVLVIILTNTEESLADIGGSRAI